MGESTLSVLTWFWDATEPT